MTASATAAVTPASVASARTLVKGIGVALVLFGAAQLGASFFGLYLFRGWAQVLGVFGTMGLGGLIFVVAAYRGTHPGIKHDGIMSSSLENRGILGFGLGLLVTAFYCILYWGSDAAMAGPSAMLDPLSQLLARQPANRWFLYGTMYTGAILVMGVRMFYKYRHSRYHLWRTGSVMFFQLGFAFLLPAFLQAMKQPEFYFTYFWPLKPEYLFPARIADITTSGGSLGVFMIGWGVIASFVLTPILTYFLGKRWYCSWVCGCGGLAETAGDPFRHLSSKSTASWRFERWSIHTVLVAIGLVTAILWINSATEGAVLGDASQHASSAYGFIVGALLSGVVGVGFYPIFGSRVWCRFFCPMAAILGIFQRFFSRFRITTNGGQCMSCGNCSTYCEMGIDVRKYAQKGENIVRASCVGCGVCAAVCPRGVLRLENGSTHRDRFDGADAPALIQIGRAIKS